MKIYNTKNITNFETILNEIKLKLNIDIDYNTISKNCFRVKLNKKKENKNYQRTGFYTNKDGSPRKINAICWHGYRDFLSQLYSYNSGLRVVTMTATYKNSMDFYRNYEQTGYKNIGSVIQPKFYNDGMSFFSCLDCTAEIDGRYL